MLVAFAHRRTLTDDTSANAADTSERLALVMRLRPRDLLLDLVHELVGLVELRLRVAVALERELARRPARAGAGARAKARERATRTTRACRYECGYEERSRHKECECLCKWAWASTFATLCDALGITSHHNSMHTDSQTRTREDDRRETAGDEARRKVEREVLDAFVPLLGDAELGRHAVVAVAAAHGRDVLAIDARAGSSCS